MIEIVKTEKKTGLTLTDTVNFCFVAIAMVVVIQLGGINEIRRSPKLRHF